MAVKFDVLSYGTVGMDMVLRIPHWPHPDVSTHTSSAVETLGGKAVNTAVHLAAWGCSVAISGTTIGDDEIGQRLVTRLQGNPGIDLRYLERQPGLKSMYCIILVTPDGERAIIGVHTDTVVPTRPTEDMIGSARLLTLDLYGGQERINAARLAREAGLPVIVGDVRQLDHGVLPFTSIAIASLAELRQAYPDRSPGDCARRIMASGADCVIVTGGSGPVHVFDRDEGEARFNPPQVVSVDTTGAGDAFRAGVVYGVLAGHSKAKAAMTGAAAGSLATRSVGATTDPASMDEVSSLAGSLEIL